ncbi:MAG: nucleotidyltransferase domain-containing protein [Thermoprotei archaeon]
MFKTGLHYLKEPYKTIVAKLLDALHKVYGDKLVSLVVYGSVARGDARRDSDLDVLIIVDNNLPRSRFERIRTYLKAEDMIIDFLDKLIDEGYAVVISPVIKTVEEAKHVSPLYLDMVEDAVIVYDKNNFFQQILLKLKEKLDKQGAERVWIGRKWYWRLKKDYRFGEVIEI